MTGANHIGDSNKMVVGDAVPKCGSCGVAWVDHLGIMGVCAENKQLRKERDEARRVLQTIVEEFVSYTPNKTPTHECEFRSNPEKGKCDAREAWGNYVGLFCSNEEEETP